MNLVSTATIRAGANMKIYDLFDIPVELLNDVGGKARGLYYLHKAGLNVAPGFIVTETDISLDVYKIYEYYKTTSLGSVAVRSSANLEDGADYSNAGQFQTFLNINTKADFIKALASCLASLESDEAKAYAETFLGGQKALMTIVIQQMVDAKYAGVVFTIDPSGTPDTMLIEAVSGIGETLVSGVNAAEQYHLNKKMAEDDFDRALKDNQIITKDQLEHIAINALKARDEFGYELDLEWAYSNKDGLVFLQARPITTNDMPSINEFDTKIDLSNHLLTTRNIGEMLPGAVTPLTISTSIYSIDWGLRKMINLAGATKRIDDVAPYSGALSIGNHLFLDLTTIYIITKKVLGGSKEAVELSILGEERPDAPDINYPNADFLTKTLNGIRYGKYLFGHRKGERKHRRMARRLKFDPNGTIEEMYDQLCEKMHTMHLSLHYHYMSSSFSGSMNSALYMTLQDQYPVREELKAKIAGCHTDIAGIESVDILHSLRVIAKSLLKENPRVIHYDAPKLLEYMNIASRETKRAYALFLSRHGHRTIREAELRNKSWADDKIALMNYLLTVLSSDLNEKKTPSTYKANRRELIGNNKGLKKMAIKFLLRASRSAVVRREYSKSLIIKVIDKFKKQYVILGKKLAAHGMLADEDLIFFLTHDEIGKLIKENDKSLNKKALARRRLFVEQSMLRYHDVYLGRPTPIDALGDIDRSKALHGSPVSRGKTIGRARIVKSIEDARKLQKGEIMVAPFTDIGWSPYYCLISGLVTEVGSALSHGAVVAREYGLPLIANVTNATLVVQTGDYVSIDANKGELLILSEEEYKTLTSI